MRKPYEVIHEDDTIVIINKKAHVLSIPDRFDPTKPNLSGLLRSRYGEIYVVHRLDMETSGIMVFAKTEEAHAHLSEQFESRSIIKKYLALCQHPSEPSGTIHTSITEHRTKKNMYIASLKGKEALTDYEVIKSLDRYALVSLRIHTGRTHQIRVHLKHIGAPLITDKKYGLSSEFFLSQIKRIKFQRDKEESPLISRSALHSSTLTLTHPKTLKLETYEAPLPKDIKAVVYQLEKVINKKR